MPRPIKCRKVCHFPDILEFRPSNEKGGRGEEDEKEVILLTVDEYETIRLIDKEGYSQEQCAGFMQIARTTVQRIYEIARKKVADAIIDGHPLRIEGGDFRICDALAMIIEEMLNQRILGVKNEKGVYITPAFPKLIYVLEEDNIHEDSKYWYLTKLAAQCTAKRMVPDYISEKIMIYR